MVASGPSFSFQESKCMYGTHFKAYDLIGKGICEDDLLYLHLCLLTCGVSYRERPSERDCTISYFLSYIVQTIIIRKMLQNGQPVNFNVLKTLSGKNDNLPNRPFKNSSFVR